jgi:hypothetical protein
MTNQHPITPPPELVQQWASEFYGTTIAPGEAAIHIAHQAAQWGADQELEACCNHIRNYQWGWVDRPDGTKMHRAVDLELARRPKPPSLKEQALSELNLTADSKGAELSPTQVELIRRALEQLND